MSDRTRNAVAAYTARDVMVPDGFNENVDLILQTYAKDLTPQEFSLFAADAHARGLSIVKRQIYATKYGGKMTIMVGIDGYRSQAESHAEYAGQDGPYWCGEDGVWRDVWLAKEPPAAAKVGIYRTGFAAPVVGIATWAEYASPGRDMWKKFPATMLAKCAEAQAIRKAFPSKLGGTYVAEEMDQAHAIETPGRVVSQDPDHYGEPDNVPPYNISQSRPEPPANDWDTASARFHAVLHKAGIDEAGKRAWLRSKGKESTKDIPAETLRKWASDIESRPDAALAYISSLIAAQQPTDAPQSAGDDVQDAEVVETTGDASQGSLTIDISPEDEAAYQSKRRAAQATN